MQIGRTMRRTLRRLLAGCVAAAMPIGIAAAQVPAGGTVIYFDAVSNQTVDPQEPQNNSSFAQGPLMAIYDSLVRLDEGGDPKAGLAESWKYSSDLTEITLKLRTGVTFH